MSHTSTFAVDLFHRAEAVLPNCRPDWVIDATFDLFVDLGASDEQCDFPVVYASGVNGVAGESPESMADSLEPLFEVRSSIRPGEYKLSRT